MNHFSVDVDVDRRTVRVRGEIDLAAAAAVRESVELASASQEHPTVTLDLADVTFLDSTGLRELVRPAVDRTDVVLRRPSDPVRKVLALTGVAELFTIVDADADVGDSNRSSEATSN